MVELMDRANVEIAVIPLIAEVRKAPLNTFVVYDDRLVLTENFSGDVVLRDPKDVMHHLELFEYFYGRALTGERAKALLLSVRDEFM
jgi:hypothetical protein